jgi:succinoglycan biosynthesis protein ExoA
MQTPDWGNGVMNNGTPTISIIVPCCNEKDHIEACLHSILAQKPPPGNFEIIVADGMSDDGTRDILGRLAQEYPCIRIIGNPGRIASTGLNSAIRAARGGIIVRMDAHTEYASDYVCQCLDVLLEVRPGMTLSMKDRLIPSI